MQRQSEEVLGLMATTDEVVTSIETHGMTVATRLDEPRPPAATLEAEATDPPNFRGNMVHLKVNLTASAQTMATSDQRHVGQLAILIGLRRERQELEAIVHGKFTALRIAFDILYGSGQAFVLAGIEGPTARTARKLVRQVDLAVDRLGQPGLALPTPIVGGIHLDAVGMAADLRSGTTRIACARCWPRSSASGGSSRRPARRRTGPRTGMSACSCGAPGRSRATTSSRASTNWRSASAPPRAASAVRRRPRRTRPGTKPRNPRRTKRPPRNRSRTTIRSPRNRGRSPGTPEEQRGLRSVLPGSPEEPPGACGAWSESPEEYQKHGNGAVTVLDDPQLRRWRKG